MNMHIPQPVLKSINLLNLGLLAIAVAGIACVVVPMAGIAVNVTPPPATDPAVMQGSLPTPEYRTPAYADYGVIAEQNLFHPSRRYNPSQAQGMARPEVILYGTLIADGMRIAYVEDRKSPRTSPGRGKRQIALKKGDTLNGYVLKIVERDRIELAQGDDRIVVYLSDLKNVRSDETTHSGPPAGSTQPAIPPRQMPATSRPGVQPGTAQAVPQSAAQQKTVPAPPQPVVQPRTTPSGPASKSTASQ
jgi:hypothetical protein